MQEQERHSHIYLHPKHAESKSLYKKADLHLHSNKSDGLVSPERIVDIALELELDAISITDHDEVEGSDIAICYAERNRLPIEVIRGVEVSSAAGHIIALNTQGKVQPKMHLADTIKEIHRQKGLAIIAHPHKSRKNSVSLNEIEKIIHSEDPELYLDGIEVFNASERMVNRFDNMEIFMKNGFFQVMEFVASNLTNPKLGALLGGSDAHTRSVGRGISLYLRDSVLTAIVDKEVSVMAATSSLRGDFLNLFWMAYAVFVSRIKKGV